MIEFLRIKNYALIEEVEAEFGAGLNILTGETGAGKSIIVDAINLLLGQRASSEMIRSGTAQAEVEAVFRLEQNSALRQFLQSQEIQTQDDQLVIRRVVSQSGKNRCQINDHLTPLATIETVGEMMVDMHGQHEHQSLLQREKHGELLDSFSGLGKLVEQMASQFAGLKAIRQEIQQLSSEDRERSRRVDFLQFELKEIDKAKLVAGEEEELRARQKILANAQRLTEFARGAYDAIYAGETRGEPIIDRWDSLLHDLQSLVPVDEALAPHLETAQTIRLGMEELASAMRGYAERIDSDPAELEQINARLDLIQSLKRKYGDSIDDILAYRERIHAELGGFENREERLEKLRVDEERTIEQATATAKLLSEKRSESAARLEKKVEAELSHLGLKEAKFRVAIESLPELSPYGLEQVEFFLCANPGEELKPLRKVASGGEVSRIMLALKSVLARADQVPTLIFDEIDVGISGTVANRVAERLKSVAASHQIICITHLPQIAARATQHFSVGKRTQKGRTVTTIDSLDHEGRLAELVRMLGGGPSSKDHAAELLRQGQRPD